MMPRHRALADNRTPLSPHSLPPWDPCLSLPRRRQPSTLFRAKRTYSHKRQENKNKNKPTFLIGASCYNSEAREAAERAKLRIASPFSLSWFPFFFLLLTSFLAEEGLCGQEVVRSQIAMTLSDVGADDARHDERGGGVVAAAAVWDRLLLRNVLRSNAPLADLLKVCPLTPAPPPPTQFLL
jgi:hypothetical protein